MGPLRLIDEVGIDVTDFIFGELEHYFPDRFTRSRATARLLNAGLKGRKGGVGSGFYRYAEGAERFNDVETRRITGDAFGGESAGEGVGDDDNEAGRICDRLMAVMVNEAERCLAEGIVKSADDLDFALLSGAGFPAFRGGLIRWARGKRS
jgi:3-hydroxyacyl-CoA dehydrogenase/enoyl-CoA hydratase/3-hydroxybutyryl-CoA epimerase